MAILRSGILGNTRGKVAGVVGSQWKDKNYIREYVKPANPNTAAQQTQRTAMSDTVAFCKALVGPVFNAYTDKFQKSMSGFNYFIKQNIAEFDGAIDYTALKLTEGKLHAPGTLVANAEADNVDFDFDASLGNNGLVTDKIFAAVYDAATNLWYFPAAEVLRDASEIDIPVPGFGSTAGLHCYLWAIQYSGTLVDKISLSGYDLAAI